MHKSNEEYTKETKLHCGSTITNKRRKHGEEASNEWRKQSNDPKNELNKDIMIRPKWHSKWIEEAPQGTCTN